MAQRKPELSPADFYNGVAVDFASDLNRPFYEKVAAHLLNLVPVEPVGSTPIKSILEVGAGCGFATRKIRERFPNAKILALEPAISLLNHHNGKIPGVQWVGGRLADFKPSHQFDLVVSSMSYHWLSRGERERFMRLAKSVALAIPVTRTDSSATNKFLVKLMLSLRVRPKWVREIRQASRVACEVGKFFREVKEADLSLRERFANHQSLSKTLYNRGVLLALFDGQAERAKEILCQSSLSSETFFNWNIKCFVGTK